MKIFKIFLSTIVSFVCALGLLGSANAKENIAWGGSNPGGVMYYMVGAAGTIISEKLPQYNITQVTTGGSTENAKRLIKGDSPGFTDFQSTKSRGSCFSVSTPTRSPARN